MPFLPPQADHATTLAGTVSRITLLQRQRQFCIKSQSRGNRACESFIARFLGYSPDLTADERKAVFKRAGSIRRSIEERGLEALTDTSDIAPCVPIILNTAASRLAWDNHRDRAEKQMRSLAEGLPVWPWVKQVKGFGALGLAIIVGEAGDIGSYPKKGHLWKRLGLAVIDGERQRRVAGAEAAAAHGYSPSRRAEIWAIADSMFKHQWAGAKDDAPAHAKGPYGEAYAARKAHTLGREGWSDARRDNDARRIMTKKLIKNLWQQWKVAEAAT